MISIKGMDKAVVLKALYDHSHCQGMSFLGAMELNHPFNIEDARKVLERSTYVDYCYGHVIKVDFSGDEFDERLYDRDCGPGAAQRAVDSIKLEKASIIVSSSINDEFTFNRCDSCKDSSMGGRFYTIKVRNKKLVFCESCMKRIISVVENGDSMSTY